MNSFNKMVDSNPYLTYVVAGVATVGASYFLLKKIFGKSKPPIAPCPPDTVQLFQFVRGPYCPSTSPFPLKLETYLRMAKIPYQNDFYVRMSYKNKIPWIRYNGEDISDSTLCMEYLNKKRGVDLNKGLSKEQRAVARAFQKMVDEGIYWIGAYYRWVTDEGFKMNVLSFGESPVVRYIYRPALKKQCYMQGIGRHSLEEIRNICVADFKAIEDFLGNKKFMMGDEPTEVDCSVFGMAAQFYWQLKDGDADKIIPEHCPKLVAFLERMKAKFWPDWDECITHGGTREATK